MFRARYCFVVRLINTVPVLAHVSVWLNVPNKINNSLANRTRENTRGFIDELFSIFTKILKVWLKKSEK